MKKQYTITENNEWEGEIFGYILSLETEQFEKIKARFELLQDYDRMSELGEWDDLGVEEGTLSIVETNYSLQEVKSINNASSNSYMDRLQFCKLSSKVDLDSFEYGSFPYKRNGMERIPYLNERIPELED